jgi:hypothetical protein
MPATLNFIILIEMIVNCNHIPGILIDPGDDNQRLD